MQKRKKVSENKHIIDSLTNQKTKKKITKPNIKSINETTKKNQNITCNINIKINFLNFLPHRASFVHHHQGRNKKVSKWQYSSKIFDYFRFSFFRSSITFSNQVKFLLLYNTGTPVCFW